MNFLNRERILLGILAVMVFAALWSEASEPVVKKDLNGDGYSEAEIHYSAGKRIEKMFVDADQDGKADRFFYYREGMRERAEKDADFDGRIDRWMAYDLKGNVWKEAMDLSGRGQPDYWRFFKERSVYRWERDRNFDGKPDRRTVLTNGTEHQGSRVSFIKRAYDDDFDGVFDGSSGKAKPPEPTASRFPCGGPLSPLKALVKKNFNTASDVPKI